MPMQPTYKRNALGAPLGNRFMPGSSVRAAIQVTCLYNPTTPLPPRHAARTTQSQSILATASCSCSPRSKNSPALQPSAGAQIELHGLGSMAADDSRGSWASASWSLEARFCATALASTQQNAYNGVQFGELKPHDWQACGACAQSARQAFSVALNAALAAVLIREYTGHRKCCVAMQVAHTALASKGGPNPHVGLSQHRHVAQSSLRQTT